MLSFIYILFTGLINYTSAQQTEELNKVASLLAGTYNTKNQSEQDSDYYHINLQIIPIWKERKDGYWFYVEQAMANAIEKPYRQRVYHLIQKNQDEFESIVLNLKDPLRFAGKTEEVEKLTTDSLIIKEGCSVYLKKTGNDIYSGSTNGEECSSDLRGAVYATSQVTLSEEGLKSWDRGFDKTGKQMWGAEKGPYNFVRIK